MRRLLVGAAIAVAAVSVAPPATAATPTIDDFVADCNDDGRVDVSGVQRYRTGTATLTGICIVVPEPGSTFVLRDVTLSGGGSLVVTTGPVSGADVTLKIIDSMVTLGGFVELSAGAAAGDPGVPEQNGRVVIRNSTVKGTGVLVTASFDWPDGSIVISDSAVESTGGDLAVDASELGGTDGVIRVRNSTLRASGDIRVRTGTDFPSGDNGRIRIVGSTLDAGGSTLVDSGPNGRTVVKATSIPGTPVTITTGLGGFCRTVALTPPIACT